MMLDGLRAEEQGRGDLLIGHAFGSMQGYSCLLGGERLSRLRSAGARLGSSGGEFVGGMKHPGGEVHLLEGLMSGAQLFPRLDALTAAAQAGTIHELRAGGLEGIRCVGMGGERGPVRLYCGLVVGGGEAPDIVPSAPVATAVPSPPPG